MRQQRDDPSGYQIVDPSRRQVQLRSRRRFDRIAFAMSVLDIIKPAQKVVLYRRRHELIVERGTQIHRGRVQRYAIVGIPLGASRHQIAYELASLVGLERLPYSVTALVSLASRRARRRR